MMFLPIGPIASAVLSDLSENKFGGQPALGEVGSDSLPGFFRWNLRVEKHEDRWARTAESGAEDTRISRELFQRG